MYRSRYSLKPPAQSSRIFLRGFWVRFCSRNSAKSFTSCLSSEGSCFMTSSSVGTASSSESNYRIAKLKDTSFTLLGKFIIVPRKPLVKHLAPDRPGVRVPRNAVHDPPAFFMRDIRQCTNSLIEPGFCIRSGGNLSRRKVSPTPPSRDFWQKSFGRVSEGTLLQKGFP